MNILENYKFLNNVSMLSLSEIKVGIRIELNGDPYEVIWREHSKMGRAGAVLRTKLRNLKNSNVVNKTFQGNDSVLEANLAITKAQYLYREDDSFYFMDESSFEQFYIQKEQIGSLVNFLKEGTSVNMLVFKNVPINVDMPIKVELKVVESPPAVKGNTADGGSKQVKLETGYTLNVPLFIKEGDIIRVNTQEGKYVERVN